MLKQFVVLLLFVNLLYVSGAKAQSRIYFNNQQLYLSGANFAWVNFAYDIGPGTTNFSRFEEIFQNVHANGGNAMRLWLHTTGANTPEFAADSMVVGPGQGAIDDLRQILDIAWDNEVGVLPCLWSFDMLRISNGPVITDRAMAMLTDTVYTRAYINNSLIPMVDSLKGHPAIIAWEIFNEPEGMSNEHGWDFNRHVPMSDIQRFINLCAGAIHRTDPAAQVTNGSWSFIAQSDVTVSAAAKREFYDNDYKKSIETRFENTYGVYLEADKIAAHFDNAIQQGNYNYYTDVRLIEAGDDEDGTLDFYTVHYYDWGGTALSPFHHPYITWDLDKPLVIAEFAIQETFGVAKEDLYDTLFKNGYAGSLAWSFTDLHLSSEEDMLASMLDIKTKYPGAVTLVFESGTISSFTANPPVIEKGQSSLLRWITSPGSEVTLNGDPVAENDSLYVSPEITTLYTLHASGVYEDSSEVTVTVLLPGTIVSFTANPEMIARGDSSVLSWHTVTGSSVTLNGNSVTADDSLIVYPLADSLFTLIASGDITDTAYVLINVLDPPDINRALNRPVYSSSNEPNNPSVDDPALAVDGNTNTRWSSAYANNQWIYVDLGQAFTILRVVLNWEVAYGQVYRIDVSMDAQNWTQIYFTSTGDGGIDNLTGLSGYGRYVRMYGISRATQWGFSLWEFEVYGLPSVGAVEENDPYAVPIEFSLEQNFPNPFNPLTTITYSVAYSENVELSVYDIRGRHITTLVNERQRAGYYRVGFDGSKLSSGIYYYYLHAGTFNRARRMVLLK